MSRSSTSTVTVEDVRAARATIAGAIKTTPLDLSATFSALSGRQIYLKLENLQKTGSFKVRGACNKIRRLVVISGGNIDINLLDRIINLGLATEGRLFRFTTELPDRPGELQRLVSRVAAAGANIRQIRHERARPGLPPTRAAVILELEARGRRHVAEIEQTLRAGGYARREEGGAE